MSVVVRFTESAVDAERATRAFLHRDPIANNVVCTLLASRIASSTAIRFWWAADGDGVLGAVFQSPSTFHAVLTRLDERSVVPLAGGVAPDLPGVSGLVPDVARFAGEYTTVKRRPGRAVEGQRVYVVEEVVPPPPTVGTRRLARDDDADLVACFLAGFEADTGEAHGDEAARAQSFIATGGLHLWEVDGEVVASTIAQPSVAGVVRVGFVYTLPAHRRRGLRSGAGRPGVGRRPRWWRALHALHAAVEPDVERDLPAPRVPTRRRGRAVRPGLISRRGRTRAPRSRRGRRAGARS